jgi:hypothetical protein
LELIASRLHVYRSAGLHVKKGTPKAIQKIFVGEINRWLSAFTLHLEPGNETWICSDTFLAEEF